MICSNEKTRSSKAVIVGLLTLAAILTLAGFRLWFRPTAGGARASSTIAVLPASDNVGSPLVRTPVKITNGVYCLGDMWPSPVYIVETADGLAMVDSGLESAHATVLAGMSELGLDVSRLKMILLTHAHGDHSMGAERLRAETDAKVFIGSEDAAALRRGGPWEAIFSKFDFDRDAIHSSTVDGELTDGQVLELGEARFTVISTPGHTPGSCCFLVELAGRRFLFTGDTIMAFSSDGGSYSTKLAPRYGGDVRRYCKSLEKLRRLAKPDFVLPGHPGYEPAPADPRLSEAQWQSLVGRGLSEAQRIAQRYAQDGADFLDGTPKELLDGVYYLGDFEGRAAYALVSGERALLFDAARGTNAAERLAAARDTLGLQAPRISAVLLTSCQAENLTGLRSIVEQTGCRVVAPVEALQVVTKVCPEGTTVVSCDELPAIGWEQVHAEAMAGTGDPQAAYYFRHGETMVLVSGTVPIDGDFDEFTRLSEQRPPSGTDLEACLESLRRLKPIVPNVWLSAIPWRGRNANLYDRDWDDTMTWNYRLVMYWRQAGGVRDGR